MGSASVNLCGLPLERTDVRAVEGLEAPGRARRASSGEHSGEHEPDQQPSAECSLLHGTNLAVTILPVKGYLNTWGRPHPADDPVFQNLPQGHNEHKGLRRGGTAALST